MLYKFTQIYADGLKNMRKGSQLEKKRNKRSKKNETEENEVLGERERERRKKRKEKKLYKDGTGNSVYTKWNANPDNGLIYIRRLTRYYFIV